MNTTYLFKTVTSNRPAIKCSKYKFQPAAFQRAIKSSRDCFILQEAVLDGKVDSIIVERRKEQNTGQVQYRVRMDYLGKVLLDTILHEGMLGAARMKTLEETAGELLTMKRRSSHKFEPMFEVNINNYKLYWFGFFKDDIVFYDREFFHQQCASGSAEQATMQSHVQSIDEARHRTMDTAFSIADGLYTPIDKLYTGLSFLASVLTKSNWMEYSGCIELLKRVVSYNQVFLDAYLSVLLKQIGVGFSDHEFLSDFLKTHESLRAVVGKPGIDLPQVRQACLDSYRLFVSKDQYNQRRSACIKFIRTALNNYFGRIGGSMMNAAGVVTAAVARSLGKDKKPEAIKSPEESILNKVTSSICCIRSFFVESSMQKFRLGAYDSSLLYSTADHSVVSLRPGFKGEMLDLTNHLLLFSSIDGTVQVLEKSSNKWHSTTFPGIARWEKPQLNPKSKRAYAFGVLQKPGKEPNHLYEALIHEFSTTQLDAKNLTASVKEFYTTTNYQDEIFSSIDNLLVRFSSHYEGVEFYEIQPSDKPNKYKMKMKLYESLGLATRDIRFHYSSYYYAKIYAFGDILIIITTSNDDVGDVRGILNCINIYRKTPNELKVTKTDEVRYTTQTERRTIDNVIIKQLRIGLLLVHAHIALDQLHLTLIKRNGKAKKVRSRIPLKGLKIEVENLSPLCNPCGTSVLFENTIMLGENTFAQMIVQMKFNNIRF